MFPFLYPLLWGRRGDEVANPLPYNICCAKCGVILCEYDNDEETNSWDDWVLKEGTILCRKCAGFPERTVDIEGKPYEE